MTRLELIVDGKQTGEITPAGPRSYRAQTKDKKRVFIIVEVSFCLGPWPSLKKKPISKTKKKKRRR